MISKILLRFGAIALCVGFAVAQNKAAKTDAEIRAAIVKDSIASYKGSCPCPFHKDRVGRNCGARSAYSKPGGAKPLCYEKDVTKKMIEEYRKG